MKVTLHNICSCNHDVVYSLWTTVVLYRFKCITFVAVVLMMEACLLAVHVESTVVLKITNLALILFSQNFLQETSYKPRLTLLLKIGPYVLGWSQGHQHGEKRKKLKPLTIHVTFNFSYHHIIWCDVPWALSSAIGQGMSKLATFYISGCSYGHILASRLYM